MARHGLQKILFRESFALNLCRIGFGSSKVKVSWLGQMHLRPQVVFIKEVDLQRAWSWQREVNALISLKHPNIVTLLESPIHLGDCLHLVLEELDMNLWCYLKNLKCPLSFVSLRPVFQCYCWPRAGVDSFSCCAGCRTCTISTGCTGI